MWITVLCLTVDAIVAVGVVYGVVILYHKWKQRKEAKIRVTEMVETRNRMVFANSDAVYTDAPAQEKPAVIGSLGIAPLPPRQGGNLPREDSMDYGVIEPWEVTVDVEHARIRETHEKMWEQDLHGSMNPL